jgi:hypothetical protein
VELTTRVEIDAPPDRVWTVVTDFDRYHEWNPFMRVAGRASENARLTVELFPPGARPVRFRPRVTRVVTHRELRWLGHLWTGGLFDGEHRFDLEPLDGGARTLLTHAESISGVLAPAFWLVVGNATERGFEAMNTALKHRVESGRGDCEPRIPNEGGSDEPRADALGT